MSDIRGVEAPLRESRPDRSGRVWQLLVVGVLACGLGLVLALAADRVGPAGPLLVVAAGAVGGLTWSRPDVAVLGVVLALPLAPVPAGPLEVIQWLTFAALLAILVPALVGGRVVVPAWQVSVPLLGFVVAAALSTHRARNADLAFRLDLQMISLVLLLVAMTTALTTHAAIHRAVRCLLLAGALTSAWAVASSGPATSFYGGAVVTGRAQGIFSQPNELGLFCAVVLVIAVAVLASPARRADRVLAGVSAVLLLAALGASLSRGAWLGAVVGLVSLAVLVPRARRFLGLAVLGALALVPIAVSAGLAGAVSGRVASIFGGPANPYDDRPRIWAEARHLMAERPVLGHGPGSFTSEAVELVRQGVFLDAEHAHNIVLNVGVEFGLLGLLSLAGLAIGLWILARRPRTEDMVPAALLSALAAVAAHGMLDYPLRNAGVLTTVWLVVGLLLAHHRVRTATPSRENT